MLAWILNTAGVAKYTASDRDRLVVCPLPGGIQEADSTVKICGAISAQHIVFTSTEF